MPADGFTKQLTRQKHKEFVRMLGLADLPVNAGGVCWRILMSYPSSSIHGY